MNTVPDLSAVSSEPVDAADVQFDVTGAIPGNDIKLFDAGPDGAAGGGDDVLIKTTPADETGYSLGVTPTDPLPAGTHHVYAVTQDDGDTASSPSALATFDVAPASPRYADLASFDTAYLNQRMPVIGLAGVDPSASKVTLYEIEDVDGVGTLVEIGSTTTIVNSTPTVTPSSPGFADGQHSLVITQTVNGVESLSNGVADSRAVIDVLASAPELETSFSGTLTNDNAPYFYASNTLTNDDHTFMRLYIDGALAGRTDPDGSSDLQADQPIAEGPHTAYVVTVDDLGHQSVTPSNTVAFTIDSVAPVAPAVTSPADGSTTASSLPVVTITTEPGASAHVVIDDDSEEIDQTADANGHATFALTHPLADGKHALYAYSNDAAGNYGDVTTTSFIVATAKAPTAPAAPTSPAAPAAPAAPVDPDHDGIANDWMIGGKAAPSPGTPKASVSVRRQGQAQARGGAQGREVHPRLPRRRQGRLQARQDAHAEEQDVHRRQGQTRPFLQVQDGRRQCQGPAGQGLRQHDREGQEDEVATPGRAPSRAPVPRRRLYSIG